MVAGFVLAFMLMPTLSAQCLAEEDARLKVELNDDMQQGRPDARALLKSALPVLWDRLVPQAQRLAANAIAANSRMVARIVPHGQKIIIEFSGEQVFAALKQARIPAIISQPRFHLLLSLRNDVGVEMQQTRTLLEEEAARLALQYGITFADDGTGLIMQWRWLDSIHIELAVRGRSRLGEFVETREITDADSLPVLQKWLDEVLLRARDAYASDTVAGETGDMQAEQTGDAPVILIVNRDSRLLEQVALEESLAQDVRVRSVVPLTLGRAERRYALRIEGGDTRWLAEWFSRRGYTLIRQSDGAWLAR